MADASATRDGYGRLSSSRSSPSRPRSAGRDNPIIYLHAVKAARSSSGAVARPETDVLPNAPWTPPSPRGRREVRPFSAFEQRKNGDFVRSQALGSAALLHRLKRKGAAE